MAEAALFYANFPSWLIKLQLQKEWNLDFLIPLAPGINDTEELEEYFIKIIDRFERLTQQSIKKRIISLGIVCKMILLKNIILTKEMRNGKHFNANSFFKA
jgi:phytoene desaturase